MAGTQGPPDDGRDVLPDFTVSDVLRERPAAFRSPWQIARIAVAVNTAVENIGARRLQTVMERVLDDISFTAPDRMGEKFVVDVEYVENHIGDLAQNRDLSRFIL